MPLIIENATHWRTPDIERLVRAAMRAAGCDRPQKERRITVTYNVKKIYGKRKDGTKSRRAKNVPQGHIEYTFNSSPRATRIRLKLPKNGPRDLHPNAMIAIAISTVLDPDATVLSPSETLWLANDLAYRFACEPEATTPMTDLLDGYSTDTPPEWAPIEDLLIYKVKDPLKDGTYLDFVAKKERSLAQTLRNIEKHEAAIAKSRRKIKDLRAKKKEIERSLKSARERRTT